jgi:hypothetical protein
VPATADRRQHDRRRAVELPTDGEGDDVVERRGRRTRFTLELEQPRHRRSLIERERVVPPQLPQRDVQRLARVLLRCIAEAAFEQLEVVPFDHRSFPRSSNRRAMMLRWISAVPP